MASNVLSPDDDPDGTGRRALMASFRRLHAVGRERGWISYDEFNQAMPVEDVSSEFIEDAMAMLSHAGINVVEAKE